MRRKGVILLDGLMALFLISALAMMVLPLAGSWLSALERGRTGTKLSETGLFAMDFMVEKIRNNRSRAVGVVRGNRYDYQAFTAGGDEGTYSFFVDREKLSLLPVNTQGLRPTLSCPGGPPFSGRWKEDR